MTMTKFSTDEKKVFRNWPNIVDSTRNSFYFKKILGANPYVLKVVDGYRVVSEISYWSICSLIFWATLFYCSTLVVFIQDQKIVRNLYNTKLKQYGEWIDRGLGTIFTTYALWKIPFDLNGSAKHIQIIVDIDLAIRNLGVNIDYKGINCFYLTSFIAQVCGVLVHFTILGLIKVYTGDAIEHVIFLIWSKVFTDALRLVLAAQYCSYLYVMRERYAMVNDILKNIADSRLSGNTKTLQIEEKFTCRTINTCSVVCGLLHTAANELNEMFRFALGFSLFLCVFTIILHLFYVMEATAAGIMYEKSYRPVCIVLYASWDVVHAVCIILLNIYFCETTLTVAEDTPQITHEIVNNDMSPRINEKAIYLSQQLLHQSPHYSRLFTLEYMVILQGARFVTIILVVLLQYVL